MKRKYPKILKIMWCPKCDTTFENDDYWNEKIVPCKCGNSKPLFTLDYAKNQMKELKERIKL